MELGFHVYHPAVHSDEHFCCVRGSVKYLDSFPSLLYLSTMTITTTGYGDIGPVSGMARMLVTLEASLGIILIGLLIHSISTRISKR